MQPYLKPPWTNSCQILCVRVFHHVLLKYGHENAEMQKTKENLMTSHFSTLYPKGVSNIIYTRVGDFFDLKKKKKLKSDLI